MTGAERDATTAIVQATARMAGRLSRLDRHGLLEHERLALREVRDEDTDALVTLIGAAYDEFTCGPLDPAGFDADLAAPATYASAHGRRWWVVTANDAPIATIAHSSPRIARVDDTVGSAAAGTVRGTEGTTVVELHRLYLDPTVRGRGLASALVTGIVDEARQHGAHRLIAWSDTRLVAAHARYLAFGFVQAGTSRELGDPAGTTEVRFDLLLEP
jgi:putative acetyltransferase